MWIRHDPSTLLTFTVFAHGTETGWGLLDCLMILVNVKIFDHPFFVRINFWCIKFLSDSLEMKFKWQWELNNNRKIIRSKLFTSVHVVNWGPCIDRSRSWMATAVFEKCSMVQGYHVYKDIWAATIREELECKRERRNSHDIYAAAVLKDDIVVGHLPCTVSHTCSLFLRRGGSILCQVFKGRWYSSDLKEGELEIPCLLKFQGTQADVDKISRLLISR